MRVENIISKVYDGRPDKVDWSDKEGVMIHRVGYDAQTGTIVGDDGVDIARAFIGKRPEFKEVSRATGGQNAYTFFVRSDGRVQQALPLAEVGYHARRFSARWIGIGCIGDFRAHPPILPQWSSATHLVALLCAGFDFDPADDVRGHGEVTGAHGGEKAPGKPAACPGDKWKMNDFRQDVAGLMKDQALRDLWRAGVVFDYEPPALRGYTEV